MKKNGIDIFDILLVLAKRKIFIIVTTFLVTVFFIIYSLLATQYWKSSVSFLTISQERTALPLAAGLMGGMGAAILGQDMAGSALNYINILRSRTFSEEIVKQFDLIEYFQIEDPDSLLVMEKAVMKLNEELLQTDFELETGMITVSIETKDRYLSRDIAQAYYELLEEYYLTSKMSKGRERRIFLEQQIADFEDNFAQLTKKMAIFQQEHRIVDMKAQTEAIVTLYAEIVAQQKETEIELEFARKHMSEESQIVTSLSEKLAVFNRTIREMERSEETISPRYIVDIDDIPSINNQFMQLNLNLEIQKKVVEFLYPQYEQAKLDELSDISTFEVIDEAVPAGLRSRPRRARMVIIAFAVSFILSSLCAYSYETISQTPRKEKVDSFLKELLRK